jgi:GT2 family glycosyltransferase
VIREANAAPTVSAVIVNYEGGDLLLDCLAALEAQPSLVDTIVVDNGSTDGSAAEAAARFPSIELVTPERNTGFAGGANLGASAANGDLILFLNPDVRLNPGSVSALAAQFEDARTAVVGPPLEVVKAGAVEYGATVDVLGAPVALRERAKLPLYISGCALMTRGTTFRELGGFDARFFMFSEDVDYCWRVLLRGHDVRVADVQPVWHAGGSATPGGYVRDGGVSSTRFRIALRERNTLTMLLKCYGGPLALVITPLYVLQSVATAALLVATRKPRTARAIIEGLLWNIRELPRTLELRRAIQKSRAVDDRIVVRRMHRSILKLRLLIRYGIPTVSDAEVTSIEAGV